MLSRLIQLGVNKEITVNEQKLVRLLNYICTTWYFLIIFFLITDYALDRPNYGIVAMGHIGQMIALIIVQYLQYKKRYEFARVIFITSSFLQFFLFCNVLVTGELIELYYILIPIFSLLFLNKLFYHFTFLILAIGSFIVPPIYFEHYSDPGMANSIVPLVVLFICVFLLVLYFKNTNNSSERALAKEKERALDDKAKIEEQSMELRALSDFQQHFFINITHELRTPLTLLKGQVNKVNSLMPDVGQKIAQNTNKIDALINDIIDVTKAGDSNLNIKLKPVDVVPVIQKTVGEFEASFTEKHIDLIIKTNIDNAWVNANLRYFERTISNILVNALKYTPEKGSVLVEVASQGQELVLSVKDSGIGLIKGDEEKIFNKFYQSDNDINHSSGSGIGLAFCKEIMQLHHGSIQAANWSDGAVFTIKLPLVEAPASSVEKKAPVKLKVNNRNKSTILVVDDNREMCEYIADVLSNYQVVLAENGKEALKVLEEQHIDALVTDYMMPVMDGASLVRSVKSDFPDLPIIMITARADSESKLEMLRLGIDDYLNKPFEEEELKVRLSNILSNNSEKSKADQSSESEGINEKDSPELTEQCRAIIQKHISDANFGVIDIAESLNISERSLYRKLKAETGLTPNKLIQEVRLLHTRYLIENEEINSLSELAESVGLKNSTHLKSLYYKRFGTSI